eukprot:m.175367 g.175367  ORF g.175367 m.175367 type:complete len:63 (-) comp14610_c0_seq3:228-416(-)
MAPSNNCAPRRNVQSARDKEELLNSFVQDENMNGENKGACSTTWSLLVVALDNDQESWILML